MKNFEQGIIIYADYHLYAFFFLLLLFCSQSTLAPAQTAAVTSTTLNRRKDVLQKSSRSSTNNPLMRNQTDKVVSPKNTQESNSGYEAKLVEMINTTIVDRSPSVKWDDVGEKLLYALPHLIFLFLCLSFSTLNNKLLI